MYIIRVIITHHLSCNNVLIIVIVHSDRSVLLVKIMKAENIPDHDGEPPSVVVECAVLPGKESQKSCATAVQIETVKPVFEETFEYKVDFEELWRKRLHFIVWYVDRFSCMSGLGEVIHSLGQLDIEGFNISETAMLVSKDIVPLYHTKVIELIISL